MANVSPEIDITLWIKEKLTLAYPIARKSGEVFTGSGRMAFRLGLDDWKGDPIYAVLDTLTEFPPYSLSGFDVPGAGVRGRFLALEVLPHPDGAGPFVPPAPPCDVWAILTNRSGALPDDLLSLLACGREAPPPWLSLPARKVFGKGGIQKDDPFASWTAKALKDAVSASCAHAAGTRAITFTLPGEPGARKGYLFPLWLSSPPSGPPDMWLVAEESASGNRTIIKPASPNTLNIIFAQAAQADVADADGAPADGTPAAEAQEFMPAEWIPDATGHLKRHQAAYPPGINTRPSFGDLRHHIIDLRWILSDDADSRFKPPGGLSLLEETLQLAYGEAAKSGCIFSWRDSRAFPLLVDDWKGDPVYAVFRYYPGVDYLKLTGFAAAGIGPLGMSLALDILPAVQGTEPFAPPAPPCDIRHILDDAGNVMPGDLLERLAAGREKPPVTLPPPVRPGWLALTGKGRPLALWAALAIRDAEESSSRHTEAVGARCVPCEPLAKGRTAYQAPLWLSSPPQGPADVALHIEMSPSGGRAIPFAVEIGHVWSPLTNAGPPPYGWGLHR
jgi:hypothetical protein